MRNLRLRLISAILFCQAALTLWGTASLLNWVGANLILTTILLVNLAQLGLALQLGLGGDQVSELRQRQLGYIWALGLVVLAFPALLAFLGLLPMLGTLQGFLNILCLGTGLATLKTLLSTVLDFLKSERQRSLEGARSLQQMFAIHLALGSLYTLILVDGELAGVKVSISLAGAFFYGFPGWKVWNGFLLLLSLGVLGSQKFQRYASWALSLLFLSLPLLAGPAFQALAPTGGIGLSLQGMAILLPVLVILFTLGLSHEVSQNKTA